MSENAIPPKSEWPTLSATQLFDVKTKMTNMYYDMQSINATFAKQYLSFISQLEAMIALKESERDES